VGGSEEDLDRVEARLATKLPADYRAPMRRSDGAEAEFGQSWVVLWRVGDLVEHNEAYRVAEFAPGLTFFGSNGAGEAYAWDWRPTRRSLYVVIPFITPDPEATVPCADTFEEFLSVLHTGIPFHSSGR
jgi:cell wall assembly regulator SMI1